MVLSSEERDEAKKQLSTVMEESHKHRAELSRINSLLVSAQYVATGLSEVLVVIGIVSSSSRSEQQCLWCCQLIMALSFLCRKS